MSASTSPAAAASPSSSPTTSILSSSASCASLCSTRSTCSDHSLASTSSLDCTVRPNEHLAVLLPKNMWKPDNAATKCDTFQCPVLFSVFQRRHHCRKCGGVFCHPCTERSTTLLDTSKLGFLHPPKGKSVVHLATPESPARKERVCDDCYDQIYGLRSPVPSSPLLREPARPVSLLASPIALFKSPVVSPSSSPPSRCDSPLCLDADEADLGPSLKRASTTAASLVRPRRAPLVRTSSLPYPPLTQTPVSPSHSLLSERDRERSYGELDAYPLRRSSALCKASGGGRWAPQAQAVDPAARLPIIGGRAPYEVEMEREEMEERKRRSNPVVKHGDFQYRIAASCEPEPAVLERVPIPLATF